MAGGINAGGVHHLKLTVTDVARSQSFYEEVLGFSKVADLPNGGAFLSNGSLGLAVGTSPDPAQASADDVFNENRVGLDHLSLVVTSRDELERAVSILDEKGVPHGDITELTPFGIAILAFRDPDNVQLELSAPLG
jgi:glyoxylase I family protein